MICLFFFYTIYIINKNGIQICVYMHQLEHVQFNVIGVGLWSFLILFPFFIVEFHAFDQLWHSNEIVPCLHHVLYDEFDEADLTFGDAACAAIEHWHHNWQTEPFLFVRLHEIFLGYSVLVKFDRNIDETLEFKRIIYTLTTYYCLYLFAHSSQKRKGRAGLLTSAHLISMRRINM